MKHLKLLVAVIITMAVAVIVSSILVSCSPKEQDFQTPEAYKTINETLQYSQIDHEVVALINDYRLSKGLNALSLLDAASKQAISHNYYMIDQGEPSHDYFYLRLQNLKNEVNAQNITENVAYGFTNAQALVNAWLNSDGHKQNIENPEVTDIGISTKQDENNNNYFTNIFVKL